MNSQKLIDDLDGMVNKVEDIMDLYGEYEKSDVLSGIKIHCEFVLDIIGAVDDLAYSYLRFKHQISELSKLVGEEVADGMYRVNDFAHGMIEMDDVFDEFPSDENIALKSLLVSKSDPKYDYERSL